MQCRRIYIFNFELGTKFGDAFCFCQELNYSKWRKCHMASGSVSSVRFFFIFLPISSILLGFCMLLPRTVVTVCEENVSFDLLGRVQMLLPPSLTYRSKQVIHGSLQNSPVVVKAFPNSTACQGFNAECLEEYTKYTLYEQGHLKTLVMCPDAKSIVAIAIPEVLQSVDFEFATEIIMKKALHASNGWPVPKLLSHCRNTIIEEYIGPSVSSLFMDSFTTRLKIAAGLLMLADTFTFKHERFRFYLTDISLDNVVVRPNLEVALVDLDHVIVLDKTHQTDDPKWGRLHMSESWEDEEGFVYSTSDVCSHSLSDHNFFAVCQHILARNSVLGEGLLENLSADVKTQYPDLERLVLECSRPKLLPSRIEAGQQLINLIESILSG